MLVVMLAVVVTALLRRDLGIAIAAGVLCVVLAAGGLIGYAMAHHL
jgi:hypothetical protein